MELLATWIADLLIGRSSDYAPRTLLGWTSVGLLAGLIAQIVYVIYICFASSVPAFLSFSILANTVALVVVRRALRWRYPI
jgi:hypothetical protein